MVHLFYGQTLKLNQLAAIGIVRSTDLLAQMHGFSAIKWNKELYAANTLSEGVFYANK